MRVPYDQNVKIKNKQMKLNNIEGILFDYGATIDTNGTHWAEVLWDAYEEASVPVDKSTFREAYVYGERYLAMHPVIEPADNFLTVLLKKTDIQLNYLTENNHLSENTDIVSYSREISQTCYDFVKKTISNAFPVLDYLHKKYPMVLVSNFYGNVETVLEDFRLRKYFNDIIESAVVGVRKPDPEIFSLGVKSLKLPAQHVVVVGDSYTKDIKPASEAGCKTIWIKGKAWEEKEVENPIADRIITDFSQLSEIL
jgi:putative hydrolase of the HAD superfamily